VVLGATVSDAAHLVLEDVIPKRSGFGLLASPRRSSRRVCAFGRLLLRDTDIDRVF
jgi:hypothetical protein